MRDQREQKCRALVIGQLVIPGDHECSDDRACTLRTIRPWLAGDVGTRLHRARLDIAIRRRIMAAMIKPGDAGQALGVDDGGGSGHGVLLPACPACAGGSWEHHVCHHKSNKSIVCCRAGDKYFTRPALVAKHAVRNRWLVLLTLSFWLPRHGSSGRCWFGFGGHVMGHHLDADPEISHHMELLCVREPNPIAQQTGQ